MTDSGASNDKTLLWGIAILVVVSGLGNAAMTASLSSRVSTLEQPTASEFPDIRPIVGTVQRSEVRGPKSSAPLQTPQTAKAKVKAKAKAKAAPKGKHAAIDAKLTAFAGTHGIQEAKVAAMKQHVHGCYEALDRIQSASKAGKIDKSQRQKRMLNELKKRDDRLKTLLGPDLARQLKTEVLTQG